MMRDIEYAAVAVRRLIVEKFGAQHDLSTLTVHAAETTIVVADGDLKIEETRDKLLSWLRSSATYGDLYELGAPTGLNRPK